RPRDLVDAVALGPGRLLQLQAAEFDVELVARLVQPVEGDEGEPVLVAVAHHQQRGRHVGDHQHREQHVAVHAASLSATRSTALRARGFAASSASPAFCAPPTSFRVGLNATSTGMRRLAGGAFACLAMYCLTMRSSSEWKLITASRPPGFSFTSAASRPASRSTSSRLMKMRMAWKERVAGWILESPRGITDAISSASCAVRSSGASLRRATIARAMRRLCRS